MELADRSHLPTDEETTMGMVFEKNPATDHVEHPKSHADSVELTENEKKRIMCVAFLLYLSLTVAGLLTVIQSASRP
jgi:hypothetical protein